MRSHKILKEDWVYCEINTVANEIILNILIL